MTDPNDDARNALRLIGPDPQNWVPERPGPDGRTIDHNVLIVGGGQSGCAFAFACAAPGSAGSRSSTAPTARRLPGSGSTRPE